MLEISWPGFVKKSIKCHESGENLFFLSLVLETLEMWTNFSLQLLPDSLWLGVVVSVRASSVGQIDMFKNYLYSIGHPHKKHFRNDYSKHVNISVQWM